MTFGLQFFPIKTEVFLWKGGLGTVFWWIHHLTPFWVLILAPFWIKIFLRLQNGRQNGTPKWPQNVSQNGPQNGSPNSLMFASCFKMVLKWGPKMGPQNGARQTGWSHFFIVKTGVGRQILPPNGPQNGATNGPPTWGHFEITKK